MLRVPCAWLLMVLCSSFSEAHVCEPGTGVCESKADDGKIPAPKQGRSLVQMRLQGKRGKLVTEATEAMTTRTNSTEVPMCKGCTHRPSECWKPCGAKRGYCGACNSAQGTRGACCKRGGKYDPEECKRAVKFRYSGYHECVLVQEPACVDQTPGGQEWHDSSGETYNCKWYNSNNKCKSVGSKYRNMGLTANEACCSCGGGKPPAQSSDVTTTTTTTEVPLCTGCTGRPSECWSPCGKKRGYCEACNSAKGMRGACCKRGDKDDPEECGFADKFRNLGYHECVLVQADPGPTNTYMDTTPGDRRRRRRRRGNHYTQCYKFQYGFKNHYSGSIPNGYGTILTYAGIPHNGNYLQNYMVAYSPNLVAAQDEDLRNKCIEYNANHSKHSIQHYQGKSDYDNQGEAAAILTLMAKGFSVQELLRMTEDEQRNALIWLLADCSTYKTEYIQGRTTWWIALSMNMNIHCCPGSCDHPQRGDNCGLACGIGEVCSW